MAKNIKQKQDELSDEEVEETTSSDDIEEIKKKAQEYLEGWKRAQADYQNLQRETYKRIEGVREIILHEYISEMLPVYTCLESAMSFIPEDQKKVDWVRGVFLIRDKMKSSLALLGLSEIDCLNKPFDPKECEAIGEEESTECEPNIVIKILSPGFKLKDKVVVPAKVIVSK